MDENLPVDVAERLREAGHDAVTILEQQLGGEPDPDVATVCQREARALVTLDTDFADIRAYPPEEYAGLVVFRLRQQAKPHVLKVIERLLLLLDREAPEGKALEGKALEGQLWIVEEDQVRIRS